MSHSPEEIERILHTYGNMLYRMCTVMLGNSQDAEDVVQETIIRYFQKAPPFGSDAHEKAWLVKVAVNQCRDLLRFRSRHPQVTLESVQELAVETESSGILEALMTLPEKFRIVLILHYVEGYRTEEIGKIIGKTGSAVKMRLQKGRKLLEERYRREYL